MDLERAAPPEITVVWRGSPSPTRLGSGRAAGGVNPIYTPIAHTPGKRQSEPVTSRPTVAHPLDPQVRHGGHSPSPLSAAPAECPHYLAHHRPPALARSAPDTPTRVPLRRHPGHLQPAHGGSRKPASAPAAPPAVPYRLASGPPSLESLRSWTGPRPRPRPPPPSPVPAFVAAR